MLSDAYHEAPSSVTASRKSQQRQLNGSLLILSDRRTCRRVSFGPTFSGVKNLHFLSPSPPRQHEIPFKRKNGVMFMRSSLTSSTFRRDHLLLMYSYPHLVLCSPMMRKSFVRFLMLRFVPT